jgi:hypothetical protein
MTITCEHNARWQAVNIVEKLLHFPVSKQARNDDKRVKYLNLMPKYDL